MKIRVDLLENLPIYPFLGEIADRLLASPSRFLVLTAETAAGKSTAVPAAFLNRVPGKILMLEPRRVAAISIAERVSAILGERPGETCGYRIRLDSRVGPRTKIEIMTEAILTRRIQGDPALEGVSVIILDEFHERSIHTDLALALLKEVVTLRDDLFVIVMSATIDADRASEYLSAPTMKIPGRRFPVESHYESPRAGETTPAHAARVVDGLLADDGGDILVFLPGMREIRKTENFLSSRDADVLTLHSSVSQADQRRAIEGRRDGDRRRVILSSSIAETSVTVPGVSLVVDSGLTRLSRYDAAIGMDRLETETESAFQAEQRAGRAGRTGPGRCVRLWAESDARVREISPEIVRSDIVPLALECALWGAPKLDDLEWLDRPNGFSWDAARELLTEIGALDGNGRLTPRGKKIAALGVHPRVAAVALEGEFELAAQFSARGGDDREIERTREDLVRRVGTVSGGARGVLALLSGFPDRIARHAGDGKYRFPSGRVASLNRDERSLATRPSEWICAPDVDAGEREGVIRRYLPIEESSALEWITSRCGEFSEIVMPRDSSAKPHKMTRRVYGKLVVSERREELGENDRLAAARAKLIAGGFSLLPWEKEARALYLRAKFAESVSRSGEESPRLTDPNEMMGSIDEWLIPFCSRGAPVDDAVLLAALRYRFEALAVDRAAPARISLANGRNRPLDYEEPIPGEGVIPVLETRVQDIFGCPDTPLVSGVPVLLRLLSPARRPVQVTRDLAGFWRGSWADVRKEMRGRYPKHFWPENPATTPEPERPPRKN